MEKCCERHLYVLTHIHSFTLSLLGSKFISLNSFLSKKRSEIVWNHQKTECQKIIKACSKCSKKYLKQWKMRKVARCDQNFGLLFTYSSRIYGASLNWLGTSPFWKRWILPLPLTPPPPHSPTHQSNYGENEDDDTQLTHDVSICAENDVQPKQRKICSDIKHVVYKAVSHFNL